MTIKVLFTGGAGFLAINTARYFKENGASVYGLGRSNHYSDLNCYEKWVESSITYESLLEFEREFDVIVHCGGGSSVGFAQENPIEDFEKTVVGTAHVLEFIRQKNPNALVIYPSSPAVHGQQENGPIDESAEIKPASVYGYHKKMAEDLLFYSNKFHGVNVSVIRFYSIYGPGLRKQLLWDACVKLTSNNPAVFWGSGNETRDWINIKDAVSLVYFISKMDLPPVLINGGTGMAMTVCDTVHYLNSFFETSCLISFNGNVKSGDPKYYCAGKKLLSEIGWKPKVKIKDGFAEYVDWFKSAL